MRLLPPNGGVFPATKKSILLGMKLHEVMKGRKNTAHVEKGKREKDKQKLKNDLKNGKYE